MSLYFAAPVPAAVQAAALALWLDALEDWTPGQVRAGFAAWDRAHPCRRPTPGAILDLLMRMRGEAEAARRRAAKSAAPAPAPGPVNPDPAARARMAALAAELFPRLKRVPVCGGAA